MERTNISQNNKDHKTLKKRIDKLDFIKSKNIESSKDTMKKILKNKPQTEKIFVTHIKKLKSRIFFFRKTSYSSIRQPNSLK